MTFTMSSEETDMLKATNENKVWTLEIAIGENADETEAQARLSVGDTEMVGWGRARRNPHDPARPRVGEELAVARALSDLSHRLLDAAVTEIEEFEGQPVHLEG
jgi:Rv2632c-like